MRSLIWYLILLAVAVVAAILFQGHSGNVLIIAQPWRIELSLSLAIVILILVFLVLHWLLRITAWFSKSPGRFRSWRSRKSNKRDFDLIEQSWLNTLQGNYVQAEKDLDNLINRTKTTKRKVLSALSSARSLHFMGEYKRCDQQLQQARLLAADDNDLKLATAVITAKIHLERQQPEQAIDAVSPFVDNSTKSIFANRLLLRAYAKTGDNTKVFEITRKLLRSNAIDKKQAHKFICNSVDKLLLHADEAEYKKLWSELKSDERMHPNIALAAAKAQNRFGNADEAARIMQNALKQDLDESLLHYYAHCDQSQASKRIGQAEIWLKTNHDNPALLACLGQLCLVAQLWGQAKHYLERSLELRPDVYIHALLGSMHDVLGKPDLALKHWRFACAAAEAEIPAIQRLLPPADTNSDPHFAESDDIDTVSSDDPMPQAASAVYTEYDTEEIQTVAQPDPDDSRIVTPADADDEYFDSAPIPGVDMSQTSESSKRV